MDYFPRLAAAFALIIFAIALNSPLCKGGVAVLVNDTPSTVQFSTMNSEGKQQKYTLAHSDLMPIPIAGKIGISFQSGGKQRQYLLQANTINHFVEEEKTVDLKTFPIPAPADEDARLPPPKAREIEHFTLNIPVKILVDDDQPAVRKVWEKELRERIEAASEIFERHCGVRFEVVAVDTWVSNNALTDLYKIMQEFESKVNPAPARLAIGFTSQYTVPHGLTHLGGTRGPLYPYILVREWSQHVSKSERLEILVHEMGHYLGASHTSDMDSVMRPQLGDRQSHSLGFRIGFDPLNTLAMNVLTDELRARAYRGFPIMPPDVRRQLERIYLVLKKQLPDDPAADAYLSMLNLPKPGAQPQRLKPSELALATREVVQAVVGAARTNDRAAAELKADALTEYLIRRAAAEASKQPRPVAAKSFLLGIGISLDDSRMLYDFPMLGDFYRSVESEYDRQERLSVLGRTTMLGRHDFAQHFVVSCALAAQLGPLAAEQAGIAKEISDAQGESGFSFADLSADMAGAAFAANVGNGKINLDQLAESYKLSDFMPGADGLKESIAWKDFTEQYGSVSDARCQKVLAEIQARIQSLPGYKKLKAPGRG